MRTYFFFWYWYELVIIAMITWAILYYIKWYVLDGEDEFVLISRYLRDKFWREK